MPMGRTGHCNALSRSVASLASGSQTSEELVAAASSDVATSARRRIGTSAGLGINERVAVS